MFCKGLITRVQTKAILKQEATSSKENKKENNGTVSLDLFLPP
jgi:hypothetical protein